MLARSFRSQPRRHFRGRSSERGAALLVVVLVTVVILVGGLAAVSMTAGELGSSAGYRSQEQLNACVEAAVQEIRLSRETGNTSSISRTVAGLDYRSGHYDSSSSSLGDMRDLDLNAIDLRNLFEGTNISNALGPGGGASSLSLVSATATCETPGYGEQEMSVVFRVGIPGAR